MKSFRVTCYLTDKDGDERRRVWYEKGSSSTSISDKVCRVLDNCLVDYTRLEVDLQD